MPNETPKRFVQVFINGDEKNLPKEKGHYPTHHSESKMTIPTGLMFFLPENTHSIKEWMSGDIDWYLQPEPEGEKGKEECPCKDQTCFVDSDNDLLGCKHPQEPAQRTAETTEEIRKEFFDLTGTTPDNSQGEPDIEYVWWLENRLAEYRRSALPTEAKKIMQTTDEYYEKQ